MGDLATFPFDPIHTEIIRSGGFGRTILDPFGLDKKMNPDAYAKKKPPPEKPKRPRTPEDDRREKYLATAEDERKKREQVRKNQSVLLSEQPDSAGSTVLG